MEIFFLGIVVLLFLLAVFDLTVGVSNDAVNFLTSAVGSKAASFKVVIIVASLGVFVGAAMSNGMMDVARNSIFRIGDIIKYAVGGNPLPARNFHNLLEPVFISYYASFKIPDSAHDADNHESYDSQCS